jgi:branched-chain amino acid transport system substrate-binding protein
MGRAFRMAAAGGLAFVLVVPAGCALPGQRTGGNCVAPGTTGKTIKIGVVTPDSGSLAQSFAPVRAGIEARIGLANRTGGVHGRQIELRWQGDQSRPGTNLAAARTLVESDGVFGLLEETGVAAGSAAYLDARGVPVAGIVAEPVWAEHRNMFAYSYRYANGPLVSTAGQYARRAGGTRAFVLESLLTNSSHTAADDMAASLASQGILVVGTDDYTDGVTDPNAIVTDLRRSGADVIVGSVSGHALATVLRAARAAHLPIKTAIGPDGYDPQLPAQFGPSIAGMAVFIDTVPFEPHSAALDAYRDAMSSYAPEEAETDQLVALQGYITADLFIRGLQVAGACPDRAGFIGGLRAVSDYDAGGLLPGPINMKTTYAQLNACYFFVRVNEVGTGWEVVPGGSGRGGREWCGREMVGR